MSAIIGGAAGPWVAGTLHDFLAAILAPFWLSILVARSRPSRYGGLRLAGGGCNADRQTLPANDARKGTPRMRFRSQSGSGTRSTTLETGSPTQTWPHPAHLKGHEFTPHVLLLYTTFRRTGCSCIGGPMSLQNVFDALENWELVLRNINSASSASFIISSFLQINSSRLSHTSIKLSSRFWLEKNPMLRIRAPTLCAALSADLRSAQSRFTTPLYRPNLGTNQFSRVKENRRSIASGKVFLLYRRGR